MLRGLSREQWRTLLACSLGAAFGYGTLGVAVFGQFVIPLSSESGHRPDDIALAFSAMTLGAIVAPPLAGRLIDRIGPRRVIAASAVLMALMFCALAQERTLSIIYLLYGAVALTGSGTLATAYSRPIVAAFDERRGTALGIMLSAVGLGAAILPPILNAAIEGLGVGSAYLVLAVVAIAAALPAALLLPARDPDPAASGPLPVADTEPVGSAREMWHAAGSATGLKLIVISLLLGLFSSGVWSQVVPILAGRGLGGTTVAWTMAGLAIVLTVTRLVAGVAMDRVFAPTVGFALLVPVAAAWLLLAAAPAPGLTVLAVLVFGLGLGVEFDLFSYLTSKYFPRRIYSSIYGLLYSAVSVGLAGGSPLFAAARRAGFAEGGLIAMAAACFAAAAILLTLPRYALRPAAS